VIVLHPRENHGPGDSRAEAISHRLVEEKKGQKAVLPVRPRGSPREQTLLAASAVDLASRRLFRFQRRLFTRHGLDRVDRCKFDESDRVIRGPRSAQSGLLAHV
jgi:hypothetical protein